MGEALFVQGELQDALERMEDTEHMARSQYAHQNVIWALCQQSEISVAMGLLQKAYNIQEKAFQYAEENRMTHLDRKSTRLNSSHVKISYAVFCLKKKKHRHRI